MAAQVRSCTNCRLHAGRTNAVPGEGHPDTEVMFVGEGPGFNEDRQGRPFVGRAGELLVRLLGEVGWRRDEVFITNVVKCRPPDNRDPEPDEIAACALFLQRQLEILQPALVVTLGRHSLGRFMPGARIGQVHGTYRDAAEGTAPAGTTAYAMYHPAAALRTPESRPTSFQSLYRPRPTTGRRGRTIFSRPIRHCSRTPRTSSVSSKSARTPWPALRRPCASSRSPGWAISART
ncbi:MAG: uracil-DNA glycosylase [Chloroflexi bacterium]|nr:MAG: uracil-DNA glycosylase [Chloroflexota bacterium]